MTRIPADRLNISSFIAKEKELESLKITYNYKMQLWIVVPLCLLISITFYGPIAAICIFLFWLLIARHNSKLLIQKAMFDLYFDNPTAASAVLAARDEIPSIDTKKLADTFTEVVKKLDELGVTEKERQYVLWPYKYHVDFGLKLGEQWSGGAPIIKIPETANVWNLRLKPECINKESIKKYAVIMDDFYGEDKGKAQLIYDQVSKNPNYIDTMVN